MPELTIGIATIGRPKSVNRLIKSLDRYVDESYYLMILDNTYYYEKDWNPDYKNKADIFIPIDDRLIGCSESNNILAHNTHTRYLMHLDDDLFFRKDIVSKELNHIKSHDCDIVSCCWYDSLYKGLRAAKVDWIVYSENDKKHFKKITLDKRDLDKLNPNWEWVESREALHSMIVDTKTVYGKGIFWDNDFSWKGDRESFFLKCNENDKKVHVLNEVIRHDPIPFEVDSIKKVTDRTGVMDLFYEKYGYQPDAHWDIYWGDVNERR